MVVGSKSLISQVASGIYSICKQYELEAQVYLCTTLKQGRGSEELTGRRGADNLAAGVPEARRDPGPGARVRVVVVLQRHLNAHPPPLPNRRRQVQDHAHAHLDLPRRRRIIPLRRGRLLQARRQDAAPGQSEAAEAEGGEDEATRRVRPPHLPTYLPTTPSAPAGQGSSWDDGGCSACASLCWCSAAQRGLGSL